MPEVTFHAPGTPCWAELSTNDDQGAVSFYEGLFDWKDDPQEMGPGQYYHMQQMKGLPVAALYKMFGEELAGGTPAHWKTYFAVTNADEAAARVTEAGGTVCFGPFDVFDAGRMAFLQDPQGAFFAVWQPKAHIGYRLTNEPGARYWNELLTTDSDAAAAFYENVLGATSEKMSMEDTSLPMDYTCLKVGETFTSGIIRITEEMGSMPPNWFVYFMTENVDVSASKCQSLGGSIISAPQAAPGFGRFAIVQDPQGAAFGLFEAGSEE